MSHNHAPALAQIRKQPAQADTAQTLGVIRIQATYCVPAAAGRALLVHLASACCLGFVLWAASLTRLPRRQQQLRRNDSVTPFDADWLVLVFAFMLMC